MIAKILENLCNEIKSILKEMGVVNEVDVLFEIPKEESFGDYSTNVAMRLAKELKKAPVMIANELKEELE